MLIHVLELPKVDLRPVAGANGVAKDRRSLDMDLVVAPTAIQAAGELQPITHIALTDRFVGVDGDHDREA